MKNDQEIREIKRDNLLYEAEIAYQEFCAHRLFHGCRSNLCEKGKKLRRAWAQKEAITNKEE